MANFRQGTDLQSIHVCDVDPTIGAGIAGGTPNMLLLRTDNNSLYYYQGPLDTDWRLCGSSATPSTAQVFSYTATGVEVDRANLVIALPAARATNLYKVFPSQGQFTNLLGMGVLTASKTVAQFVLSLSAISMAGDIFNFDVKDAT